MITRIRTGVADPAGRRLWLTALSGVLIVLGLGVRYGAGAQAAGAALLTVAAFVAGSDIAVRAWRALRLRQVSIELLVVVAAGGALVIGEYWEAAAVTFLFILGAWLEARTVRHTRGALGQLLRAAPAVAHVLRGEEVTEVPAHEVGVDEIVLVKPGQKIPVDGEVVHGAAAVDESTITGEAMPAEKAPGSEVFAGAIVQNGLVRIRTTRVGADTALARIVRRVEDAQEERAPAQRMIDRFARWYTPSIIVLAVLAFVATGDVRLALTLLVVGCPGALVISTPMSVVAGIGRAARDGILIKGGRHLESAGRITALALDKTGTLTSGRPRLVEVIPLGARLAIAAHAGVTGGAEARSAPTDERAEGSWSDEQQELIRWAAIAERGSGHPLGRPIVEAAEAGDFLPTPTELEEFPGMGVRAEHEGHAIAVGNARLFDRLGIPLGGEMEAQLAEVQGRGRTPVLVGIDGDAIGVLALADRPRASAPGMAAALREIGVRDLVLLTGDDPRAAAAMAAEIGIEEVHAGLLPEEKLEHIRRMQADGRRVGMLGDGINDAPALAAADTSIAMGAAGSDLAIETADIALLSDDLEKLPRAIAISRTTTRNMRQNLGIALVTVAGLLAAVLTGHVHMAGGMLIHQLSVLAVVGNAARLLHTH